MTLGITKSYTPTSSQIADPTAYNTDMAALFNAFSGLEAQTSTLGGLTITPSSNSTTLFKITNAAATELFSIDTTSSYLKLKATGRFYLDGGGDTYLVESSANVFDFYAGATNTLKLSTSSATITGLCKATDFRTNNGSTGTIANNYTQQLFTLAANSYMGIVSAYNPASSNQVSSAFFFSSGSGAIVNVTSILADATITITTQSSNLAIQNTSGGDANFTYSYLLIRMTA